MCIYCWIFYVPVNIYKVYVKEGNGYMKEVINYLLE